jgi:hypothetical protein
MRVDFIKHVDRSDSLLHKIAELKKQHWDYPIEEHIRWTLANLSDDDVHVCLYDEDEKHLIAYLNVVSVDYQIEGGPWLTGRGIGGVCVDKSSQNNQIGFLLTQLGTFVIRRARQSGFLFCRPHLIAFYESCRWYLYQGSLDVPDLKEPSFLFTMNPPDFVSIRFSKSF